MQLGESTCVSLSSTPTVIADDLPKVGASEMHVNCQFLLRPPQRLIHRPLVVAYETGLP
jgi:hypothetical protein